MIDKIYMFIHYFPVDEQAFIFFIFPAPSPAACLHFSTCEWVQRG